MNDINIIKDNLAKMDHHLNNIEQLLEKMINTLKPVAAPPQSRSTPTPSHDVEFFRYIRPYEPGTGEIDSQRGTTLFIQLDYPSRTIRFSYAICNHDKGEPSFSKLVGRTMSRHRQTYDIPMWASKGPLMGTDITEYIIAYISSNDVIPRTDVHLIEDHYFS